ncbi:transcriptional regulator [Leptospira stimsonii]|uniref:Transcriptional regulator n=1 Tax=Leptospira stimsonii TaxID=2202203 RepID=A0A8B3CQU3_9LEPT|nr:transcriptional regulator [Leptospira stimsonii]RHX85415.1 transcriptional regulator [Leptospira stimsonii]
MNTQKKRIKIILSCFKGNQKEFGETIGKSKQTISGWASGRFPIPENAAITIELVHGYRREWILKGQNPERVTRFNQRRVIQDTNVEISILRKFLSNKSLRELLMILSRLSRNEFRLAQKVILSLGKKNLNKIEFRANT